jgi:hypothetical protein
VAAYPVQEQKIRVRIPPGCKVYKENTRILFSKTFHKNSLPFDNPLVSNEDFFSLIGPSLSIAFTVGTTLFCRMLKVYFKRCRSRQVQPTKSGLGDAHGIKQKATCGLIHVRCVQVRVARFFLV